MAPRHRLDFGSLRTRSQLRITSGLTASCTRRPQPLVGSNDLGAYAVCCVGARLSTGVAGWTDRISRTGRIVCGSDDLRPPKAWCVGSSDAGNGRFKSRPLATRAFRVLRLVGWVPVGLLAGDLRFVSTGGLLVSFDASYFRPRNEGSVSDERCVAIRVSIFLTTGGSFGVLVLLKAGATRSKPGVWRPGGG